MDIRSHHRQRTRRRTLIQVNEGSGAPPRDRITVTACPSTARRGTHAGPRGVSEGRAVRTVDLERLGRVDGSERRWEQLRGEGPQQMGLAVDQLRHCVCAQWPGDKIGHAPPGIGDATRPAPRVARASLGEAPTLHARAWRKEIRTKGMK